MKILTMVLLLIMIFYSQNAVPVVDWRGYSNQVIRCLDRCYVKSTTYKSRSNTVLGYVFKVK